MGREEEFAATAFVEGLTAGAPVGFALVGADGEHVLATASLAAVAGVNELAAEVLNGGRPVAERELHSAGGRRFVAAARALEHDGQRLVAVVAVDITEHARTDAALRESERALTDAQRMARMGWWVLWPQSGVAVQSPELLELLDMDEDAERELSAALREAGRRAVAAGESLDFRYPLPQPDGTVRTLRLCGDLVTGNGGEGTALQGFAQDISELARAATQQQVVAELDRVALGDAAIDEVIEQVTSAAVRTLGVRRVAVLALDPAGRTLVMRGLSPPLDDVFPHVLPAGEGSFAGYTLRLRRPVVVDDWEAETRFSPDIGRSLGLRSGACVVVGGAETPYGVLMAVADHPGRFGEEDIGFLQSLANVVAEGVARRRAAEEIAELADARGRLVAQALDAEERARRSMSESLHDGALQDILAAGHDLWALGDAPGAEEARAMLRDVVARLRSVMVALHPTVLAYGGLEAALRAVAAQQSAVGGFDVEVSVDPAAIGGRDELLLSVARELLTNAARHARATRVELTLSRVPEGVVLEVGDDGAGVPSGREREALAEGHIGLAISAERVAAVGGRLALEPLPGGGTRARAELPLP
jgi:signal transduction histidine kinase